MILSRSDDAKVRHPNAIEPESVELEQTVKVCSYSVLLEHKFLKKVKVKDCASYLWKSISQLRSVTCRMGSHSVTCHPTQANTPRLYPNQTGLYSIYRPFKGGGLSKPRPRVQRATGPLLLRDSPEPARSEPAT